MASYTPRANDKYSLAELPKDILEALDFWAAATPDEPALKFPRGTKAADGMETVSFAEWKTARDLMALYYAASLNVGAPGRLGGPYSESDCTIAFLIFPVHEIIIPWFAMASLGFTVQFISPGHQPLTVAKLIRESKAHVVLHCNMNAAWLRQVWSMSSGPGMPPEFKHLPWDQCLLSLLDIIRKPSAVNPEPMCRIMHKVKPHPFVYLHSFGSTGIPKLYPIDYTSANMSAKDATFWCHQQPVEKRWRCQLQTSLPFHFSFQNPLWRSLMCGTTCAFPVVENRSNVYGQFAMMPDATDILESLHLSGADIVYASPNGLQSMLEKAASPDAKECWRMAVKNLKDAHTGGAPLSIEKAECFERHGLSVLQIFALTEAGLLFHARKEHTGNTTWLKPLNDQKAYMLFRQTADPEVYQLWLRSDFPGLRCPSGGLQPYPGNPTIQAWNTSDLFNKLPKIGSHDDLVSFVGREDDWLRCTHGTAVKALELEDFLLEAMRDVLGFDRVQALTVIGHGRPALAVVLQGPSPSNTPLYEEARAFRKVARFANMKLLEHPAVLHPLWLIRADALTPIRVTMKGSLLRRENEAIFGPTLDKFLENTR